MEHAFGDSGFVHPERCNNVTVANRVTIDVTVAVAITFRIRVTFSPFMLFRHHHLLAHRFLQRLPFRRHRHPMGRKTSPHHRKKPVRRSRDTC